MRKDRIVGLPCVFPDSFTCLVAKQSGIAYGDRDNRLFEQCHTSRNAAGKMKDTFDPKRNARQRCNVRIDSMRLQLSRTARRTHGQIRILWRSTAGITGVLSVLGRSIGEQSVAGHPGIRRQCQNRRRPGDIMVRAAGRLLHRQPHCYRCKCLAHLQGQRNTCHRSAP